MHPAELLRRAGLEAHPLEPLHGGDMGQIWRAGPYVVKTHPQPPRGLFQAEAQGLSALARSGARTPRVYWAGPEGLVLAYLPPGPPDWPALARMLAELHRQAAPTYGWPGPVFLGRFELPGGTLDDWQGFWLEKRIRPLLEATWAQLGPLGPRVEAALEAPLPREGPVLIHGDLWQGNVLHTREGPALIDPSAWWGERGVDLAMMHLFGGFPPEFWEHYQALYPIPPAVEAALPRYQLYYLLLHLCFFGRSYLPAIARTLAEG
ncbi:fructosamine kinase [Meiothermus sp. QL-1]|uniref:fructosamine kinase family protein n=1 Tax=Meiothermus sp. QL-1 TaxID=2058095 RepID=UPI000E0A5A91|nr:fructosamine kinase family protein [Meiothermus sp. QL-1]RDI96403.1 fructosamine kinase [Meiothermus sp. QL-1]